MINSHNQKHWQWLERYPATRACIRQSDTYHVCAVGSVLWVGAAIIWKEGQRAAKPPGGS